MAIRRPGISSPEWLFQDFLYQETPDSQDRYIQVKWGGEVYTRVSQSFDYSDPPYSGASQKGGDIVAQLDYTVTGLLVTVTGWDVNWRDEFPLRLGINYLRQCLYPTSKGYLTRVVGDQVYNQAGGAIEQAGHAPYAFWVSEEFFPVTNYPNDYLVR